MAHRINKYVSSHLHYNVFRGKQDIPDEFCLFLPYLHAFLTLIRWGGGRSAPRLEKPCIPLEPKVRLTSNQAENLSLWFVLRPI